MYIPIIERPEWVTDPPAHADLANFAFYASRKKNGPLWEALLDLCGQVEDVTLMDDVWLRFIHVDHRHTTPECIALYAHPRVQQLVRSGGSAYFVSVSLPVTTPFFTDRLLLPGIERWGQRFKYPIFSPPLRYYDRRFVLVALYPGDIGSLFSQSALWRPPPPFDVVHTWTNSAQDIFACLCAGVPWVFIKEAQRNVGEFS